MKNSYLFPSYFKKIGWIAFPLFAVFTIYNFYIKQLWEWNVNVFALVSDEKWFTTEQQDIVDEVVLTGLIVSLLFIAFAKRRDEDEYISKIRLDSLIWAVIVNYTILIVATWLVYSLSYLYVMEYNMLTVLILFVVKFHLALYKLKKSVRNEE